MSARLRTKVKGLIGALLLAFCAAALCACNGARLDVYEHSDENTIFFEVHAVLPTQLVTVLESSAADNPYEGKPWTVRSYLIRYFEGLAEDYGFTQEYLRTYREDGQAYYLFFLTLPREGSQKELLTLKGSSTVRTNLFLRTIEVERDARFNAWQRQFYDAYGRYRQNKATPADFTSQTGRLLFGARTLYAGVQPGDGQPGWIWDDKLGYYEETLPALWAAFPAAERLLGSRETVDALRLNHYWYGSAKMNTSATQKLPTSGGAYYLFDKLLGDGETQDSLRYYRADPTGWYIVALLAGGATVAGILLAVRLRGKKRKKPDVRDLFPYDPFDGQS